MNGVLSNIRKLSREKDKLTHQLEAENDRLQARIASVISERDSILMESKGILELLVTQGLHQPVSNPQEVTLRGSVENLVREQEKSKAALEWLEEENARHVREKEAAEKVVERLSKEKDTWQEKVSTLERENKYNFDTS